MIDLVALFGVRYEMGRYGNDPCDPWQVEEVLQYPDGLEYHNGRPHTRCRVCDCLFEYEGEPAYFDLNDPANVCGGSPACCP